MKTLWNLEGKSKKFCHWNCQGLDPERSFCRLCDEPLKDNESAGYRDGVNFLRHKKCLAAEKAYKNLRKKILKESAGICDRSAELEYAKYRLREGDEHRIAAEAYEKARNAILEEAGK